MLHSLEVYGLQDVVYLALGIRADGRKEVLGLWIEQTEGGKLWVKVFNQLKNRGLHDILIASSTACAASRKRSRQSIRRPRSRSASPRG